METAGLYLHIPFCHAKCEYCDFYSITVLDQMEQFCRMLEKELQLRAVEGQTYQFETIFLGGGTPSLLSEKQLSGILETVYRYYRIAPDAEITMESNPGTLDAAKLKAIRKAGINRLSMGVQSFQPAELQALGRIHSVAEVLENFGNARAAGFGNINLDLMTAFPGITPDSFQKSLEQALALQPEHLSCYTLIFEPNTVLYKRMQLGEVSPLGEEEEAGYYEQARILLEANDYQQYEISNFSRGAKRVCRHNLIYWRHYPYLGFGPSAHSFDGRRRFANQRSLMVYLKKLGAGQLAVDFEEQLTDQQRMFEYIFLNLRLRSGIPLADFEARFGTSLDAAFPQSIRELRESSLIEYQEGHLRLTSQGWLLADSVAARF